jgi:primary-amine oxidase
MELARLRIIGTGLVLIAGIGMGMSFPWGRAQEPDAKKAAEAAFVGETPKSKTIAEQSKERLEIVEEDGRFTIIAHFPNKTDPKRTRWKITCSADRAGTMGGPRENLNIHYAFFQSAPEAPEIQVLGQTHLAESLVCYSDGVRYYDIANHNNGLLKASPGDLADRAFTLDKQQKILCEIRDRGLHWKMGGGDHPSRRGEELVIWGTIKASNYLYVVHFGFHDDGTIQARMGSTGSNLTSHMGVGKSHMHLALWRVDVDFGERNSNEVYLVRHREPFGGGPSNSTHAVEPFNDGCAGFADWSDKEFTVLRITNPKLKGTHGRPASYDLISHRTGSARHFGPSPDEGFTRHDYYVMPYREGKDGQPSEVDCSKLLDYVRSGESLKGKDIVLWHITAAHHIPRQEDMFGGSTGATCVVWSGFDLKPRDLFDATPFFGAAKAKKK